MLLANYLLKRLRAILCAIDSIRPPIFSLSSIPSELRGFLAKRKTGQLKLPRILYSAVFVRANTYSDAASFGCRCLDLSQPLALQLVRSFANSAARFAFSAALASAAALFIASLGSLSSLCLLGSLSSLESVCCATELIGEALTRPPVSQASADPYRMGGTCRKGQDASLEQLRVVQVFPQVQRTVHSTYFWMNTLLHAGLSTSALVSE